MAENSDNPPDSDQDLDLPKLPRHVSEPVDLPSLKPAKVKGKPGRPRIHFDLDEVTKLGKIGASAQEMASFFDVGLRTVEDRMGDEKSGFRGAYYKGFTTLKRSLRRRQIEVAQNGNVGMLIWLGKQLLDQKDRRHEELSGPDGAPIRTEFTAGKRKALTPAEEANILRQHFEREKADIPQVDPVPAVEPVAEEPADTKGDQETTPAEQ